MTRYIVRRLFWYPVLLFAVTAVTLALGLYGPGDPAQQYLGKHSDPEAIARLRDEWGINQPFHVQLLKYIGDALHGDFHESLVMFPGQKVTDLIISRMGTTVQINALALTLGILIGIPLGVLAAIKHNQTFDQLVKYSFFDRDLVFELYKRTKANLEQIEPRIENPPPACFSLPVEKFGPLMRIEVRI